jgi:anti-sigma regulatory factor (Ser/Thr protein kinase)
MRRHACCEVDPEVYSVALDPCPSVAVARLMVRAALWDWKIDHLADSAQLIISELVTNAIKFATRVQAVVYLRDGDAGDAAGKGVTPAIEVGDDNKQLPAIVDAGIDDESHRGLVLVEALATRWGADVVEDGKMTWAHLEYDEPDDD